MVRPLISTAIFLGVAGAVWGSDSIAISDPATGISASVTADGGFLVQTTDPQFSFGGELGGAPDQVTTREGEDLAGKYTQLLFRFAASGALREGGIRVYAGRPVVVFSERYLAEGANAGHFPRFTALPAMPHQFGFGTWAFGFGPGDIEPGSPWLFFDADRNAFLISPASNFIVGHVEQDSGGALQAGLDPAIDTVREGFSHETILVAGKGINATFDQWGRALTDLYGKNRPSNEADVTLSMAGLWTDNGSPYYYNPGPGGQKLLDAKAGYAARGIPLGYLQADSWWYRKGSPPAWNNNGTGLWTLDADLALFPQDLYGFRQALGVPLAVHARYWHPDSPDRQQYAFSGNVPVDPLYWQHLAGYLSRSGVAVFEQDWLSGPAATAVNTSDPDAFFGNMADAMAAKGINLQYSMPKARHFLQGAKYSNLTSIRVNADGFCRDRWDSFMFDSRLAAAVGIWPFSDNFRSAELRQVALAALSAGPMAPSDEVGVLNAANVRRALRSDGVIVKPDLPLMPTDATYVAIAQDAGAPMIASTLTDFGALKAYYVFAYARTEDGAATTAAFSPAALGISADVFPQSYVYDVFGSAGAVVPTSDLYAPVVGHEGSYFLVTPVGPSGMALLGDLSKLVPLGKKRVSALTDDGAISATIEFGVGEDKVELSVYAPTQPSASSDAGLAMVSQAGNGLYKIAVRRCGAQHLTVVMRVGDSDPAGTNPLCFADPPGRKDDSTIPLDLRRLR
jgi:hypothetical protein